MEMEILALADKYDPSGIFCLASILWLFVVGCVFQKGGIFGSCACAAIFVIAVACMAGPTTSFNNSQESDLVTLGVDNNADEYISNDSQTKWIVKPPIEYLEEDLYLNIRFGNNPNKKSGALHFYYIPAEEKYKLEKERSKKVLYKKYTRVQLLFGSIPAGRFWRFVPNNHTYEVGKGPCMKIEKTALCLDDYYNYDVPYDRINIPEGHGGGGCPTWVYHPGSIWVFAIFGFLPLLISVGLGIRK